MMIWDFGASTNSTKILLTFVVTKCIITVEVVYMGMYFKDKTETLKAKITMEQNEFLMRMSVSWGVSKSEVVRIIIDSYRHGSMKDENK